MSKQEMRLATRLENMGYQLHRPHKGWLITCISPTSSLQKLSEVETLVERLEEKRKYKGSVVDFIALRQEERE